MRSNTIAALVAVSVFQSLKTPVETNKTRPRPI